MSKTHQFKVSSQAFLLFLRTIQICSSNGFVHFRQIEGLFSAPLLEEVDLSDNPITRNQMYRATLIERCKTLKVLDGVFGFDSLSFFFTFLVFICRPVSDTDTEVHSLNTLAVESMTNSKPYFNTNTNLFDDLSDGEITKTESKRKKRDRQKVSKEDEEKQQAEEEEKKRKDEEERQKGRVP